ncbi:hypothetical protein [Psychrobacillus sp. FSL H8-0487]|uniref:hypothetical protein n=1 Tax=Psychrobacillus sp. FSL H8-0487 TaxID=2921391 RepID=UPI0030FBE20A
MRGLLDTPLFNLSAMKELVKEDALYCLVAKDLQNRGHSEEYAMEIIFNSYILDDLDSLAIYKNLLSYKNEKGNNK